jgi:hypothetical protein
MKKNYTFLLNLILVFGIILNFANQIQAQGITNNGATITITIGAYVHIDGNASGNYLNQTTGINHGYIDIDGTLEVEGSWTNNATVGTVLTNTAPIDGTVIMSGAANTTMGGTAGTFFENLTINNTSAGSSLTLTRNENVLGTLTLTDGVVATNANVMIVNNTASASVTGYTANSFVFGNLRRYTLSGVTPYAFPVGNGNAVANYHLADIANNNLLGINYINGSYGAMGGMAGLTLVELTSPYLNTNGVWFLNPDLFPTSGTFDLRLYLANLGPFTDNQFAIVHRDNASVLATDWSCVPCGIGNPGLNANGGLGRINASNYALRQGIAFTPVHGQFGIGLLIGPLPIELINFTANCREPNVELNWSTASELNNDFFTLERSIDAINFNPIGNVDGAGTSNSILNYQFTDNSPLSQQSYYRLKQTDFDGQFEYSDIVTSFCGNSLPINIGAVSQNSDNLSIYFSGNEGTTYNLNLYDASGKLIINQINKFESGLNKFEVPLGFVSFGIYMITLSNDNQMITKKVVINKN